MKNHLGKKRLGLLVRQTQKFSIKQIAVAASVFSLMVTSGFFLYFNFSQSTEVRAAVAGDFRSMATGNWNSVSTWERFNGSAWVPATLAPISTDGTINIQ